VDVGKKTGRTSIFDVGKVTRGQDLGGEVKSRAMWGCLLVIGAGFISCNWLGERCLWVAVLVEDRWILGREFSRKREMGWGRSGG